MNTNFVIDKYSNYFIYQKELRALIKILKKKSFDLNGILYGEVVLNNIISKYYKEKFSNNNQNDFNEFWNTNYDTDTLGRVITTNTFDVYFKNFNDYLKFISYIQNNVLFKINDTINIDSLLLIHTKFLITVNIGKTITWSGVDIKLNLNITTKIPNGKYIEPPFEQTNYIQDILIMSKDSYGPRISKFTGLEDIDNMDIINKNMLFAKIIEDLCYYKTYILTNNYNFNNYLASKSVELINNGWNILNSPINICKNCNESSDDICVICLDNIENNTDIGIFKRNNYILHKECLINYITSKVNSNTEKLLCPYRQPIDFICNNNNVYNYLNNNY